LLMSILNDGKIISTEEIDVSSEKKNHVTLEDYNRDGYKDFSVWHLDEGMGTYKIYRLFIFSPPEGKFKEIKPGCGDDFVNIRIDGDNLINTFY
ncbi:XAC2610-related protein, partial [Enterobacter hormaechei]|uniref:XAC2610-related protein n=2 Tax=Enterobacteriaceae TaxID=543 RepID=UPI0026EA08B7